MDAECRRSELLMDTLVTIQVVGPDGDVGERVERAFEWFRRVEATCSRFEPDSEVSRLAIRTGTPVVVSPLLFEVVQFSLAVARASGGAFDPTLGQRMAARGFNRNYRTGAEVPAAPSATRSYRDVRLDPERRAITLLRPLTLDLGAVAKGMAIDLAAQELMPLRDFAIEAGGDLFLRGQNAAGEPWRVGLRHPRRDGELIETLALSNLAICTSGDYERRSADDEGHVLDPRTGRGAGQAASVSVVAPTAMLADALATAAFVLGPSRGTRFLERQGVEGLIYTPSLERRATRGFGRYLR